MEMEQLRKEFNQLLANINEHSERFTDHEHLPALEVSVMMSKIGKLLEVATILKHTVKELEENKKNLKKEATIISVQESVVSISEPEADLEPEIIETPKIEEVAPKEEQSKIVEAKQEEIKPEPTKPVEKSSVGEKFSHLPLSSLKDAFSLNDRYLFANELFKKDMALFNETIKTIDSCGSLINAQEHLNAIKTTLNWDNESDYVVTFYQLVERRFL
ncbi:MAG TPA: hypothetical protein PK649_02830 [Vicingus sp.]|nr:MAG: hypothetical protein F9K09_00580 [Flavobacteriales bacterium]MBE7441484.1 hypothetical protein [Flavobacteriales bacterium]HRN40990.1 hypothetical protein [Vicingus sp.]